MSINLPILQQRYPDRSAITPKEVAQELRGKNSRGVANGIREKMRDGKLPAFKLGDGEDAWYMPLTALAEILDKAHERPKSAESNPIDAVLKAPSRGGKRHRPLINPNIRPWLVIWKDIFGQLGWNEEVDLLNSDIVKIDEFELFLKTQEDHSSLDSAIPQTTKPAPFKPI
ncbi:MAG TPA: hypothetical protein VME63_03070 [Dyella sp.]|uniref:hypothetical protein n=1 Tax=Dyella sp. TaxID=1869338 RepID=UPI002B680395|nr:hypothetical protein [Dyella sp.]HTV84357.1 hypothetical protein [Dyella sp.]